MGDARRRGTLEDRKAAAFRMAADGQVVRIGDIVMVQGKPILVKSLTPTGFTGEVLPPQES